MCFGVYEGDRQIGFARLVTDRATFAWLCDVFIAESHRGRGLGKWLVQCASAYVEANCPYALFLLATYDAHGLYHDYGGFNPLNNPEKWMLKRKPRA